MKKQILGAILVAGLTLEPVQQINAYMYGPVLPPIGVTLAIAGTIILVPPIIFLCFPWGMQKKVDKAELCSECKSAYVKGTAFAAGAAVFWVGSCLFGMLIPWGFAIGLVASIGLWIASWVENSRFNQCHCADCKKERKQVRERKKQEKLAQHRVA